MKVLRGGPRHGFAIAAAIQQMSDDVLRVEAGSLYPALHRMTDEGLLEHHPDDVAGFVFDGRHRHARGSAMCLRHRQGAVILDGWEPRLEDWP